MIEHETAVTRDSAPTSAPTQCEECDARREAQMREAQMRLTSASRRGALDRRQFVAQSTMGALVALLGAACGGASDTTGTNQISGPVSLTVQVSGFAALANIGGMARVDSGQGTPVAAVRTSASTFAAFSLICPHFGCTVGVGATSFTCPCHGARFAANGKWTGGQATGNLTPLSTSYDPSTGTLVVSG